MKVLINDIDLITLDYMVALALQLPVRYDPMGLDGHYWIWDEEQAIYWIIGKDYNPSSKWRAKATPSLRKSQKY